MLVALIGLGIVSIGLLMYIIYYKKQINDIGEQLSFIVEHDSFKFIQTQMKPKELSRLIDECNTVLRRQRELNQQFIQRTDAINSTIIHLSHDIRTPMTSLDGYLQLAKRTDELDKKTHYIELAETRVKQMNTLVDELFLYTTLQHPDYKIELEPINAVNVVKQHLFTFLDDFSEKGIDPVIDLPETPIMIEGNILVLERICENMIHNYFTHGSGPLEIRCEEQEETVSFTFSNGLQAGHDLDPRNLFTRFYKEDRSRTRSSSGLGLSIVKSLIEKMNGSIHASIEDDTFSIHIRLQKVRKEHPYVRL